MRVAYVSPTNIYRLIDCPVQFEPRPKTLVLKTNIANNIIVKRDKDLHVHKRKVDC